MLQDYDIINLSQYLEFGYPVGVDYSLFEFEFLLFENLSLIRIICQLYRIQMELTNILKSKLKSRPCLALLGLRWS